MYESIKFCIIGALAMGAATAGLFFLRFWKETGDRLFFIFAIAFWLFAATRVAITLLPDQSEHEIYFYALRLAAFGLILTAIIDKNRPRPEEQT